MKDFWFFAMKWLPTEFKMMNDGGKSKARLGSGLFWKFGQMREIGARVWSVVFDRKFEMQKE